MDSNEIPDARTDMPRKAFRYYEEAERALDGLPLPLRQAADELIILCYSSQLSPLRTARVAAYLAMILARMPRTDIEDFLERRQQELAGGPVEPVETLVAMSRRIVEAIRAQDERTYPMRTIEVDALPDDVTVIETIRDLGAMPVPLPKHDRPRTYEWPRSGIDVTDAEAEGFLDAIRALHEEDKPDA